MSFAKKLIKISAVGIIVTGASLSAFAGCGGCQTNEGSSDITELVMELELT